MKTIKMIVLVAILALTSCEDIAPDCNCDRVIDPISQFRLPNGYTWGAYKTKNDCTGEITIRQYEGVAPRVGSCK